MSAPALSTMMLTACDSQESTWLHVPASCRLGPRDAEKIHHLRVLHHLQRATTLISLTPCFACSQAKYTAGMAGYGGSIVIPVPIKEVKEKILAYLKDAPVVYGRLRSSTPELPTPAAHLRQACHTTHSACPHWCDPSSPPSAVD